MRLPNGYGSVYKLSGKRRKPFAPIITTGWTDEGKAIRKYLGYFDTRSAALKALADYNEKPYNIQDTNISLLKFWEKYTAYCASRDKPVPSNYKAAFKRMEPYYNIPFREVTGKYIQEAIDRTRNKPSLAKLIKVVMTNLYKYANFVKLSTENCALSVELPEIPRSTLHYPFSDNELDQLWEHADEVPAQLALMLCYTGMRPTELAQLRIENIHLDDRYMIGGIKTKAGKNREIPIHEKIVPIIKQWYDPENKFLLVYEGRHILGAPALLKIWNQSNLPALVAHTPHDGRHTCETRMDNAGVNKRIIQMIIGHAGDVDAVYTAKTTQQLIDAVNLI